MQERYAAPVFAALDAALAAWRLMPSSSARRPTAPPMALQVLRRGCDVFIEKPLRSTSLVPKVRAAIAEADRFVAVAYVYHLMPWIPGAREFLKQRANWARCCT